VTAEAGSELRVLQRVIFPGEDLDVVPLYVETDMERGAAELAAELVPASDPAEVAGVTTGFTPADFALVAQRSAQLAFDRAVAGGDPLVTQADVLKAVAATRPSVSSDASDRFELESKEYARL